MSDLITPFHPRTGPPLLRPSIHQSWVFMRVRRTSLVEKKLLVRDSFTKSGNDGLDPPRAKLRNLSNQTQLYFVCISLSLSISYNYILQVVCLCRKSQSHIPLFHEWHLSPVPSYISVHNIPSFFPTAWTPADPPCPNMRSSFPMSAKKIPFVLINLRNCNQNTGWKKKNSWMQCDFYSSHQSVSYTQFSFELTDTMVFLEAILNETEFQANPMTRRWEGGVKTDW